MKSSKTSHSGAIKPSSPAVRIKLIAGHQDSPELNKQIKQIKKHPLLSQIGLYFAVPPLSNLRPLVVWLTGVLGYLKELTFSNLN